MKQWKKEGLIVIGQWDKVSEYMNESNLISLGENYSVVALKLLKQITDLKAEIKRLKVDNKWSNTINGNLTT